MEADTERIEVKSNEQLLVEIRNVLASANQVSKNNLIKANKTGGKPRLSKLQQKLQNIVGCRPDSLQNIKETPNWRHNNYSISFILNSSNCAKKFGFPCFKNCCAKSLESDDSASIIDKEKPIFSFPKNHIEMLNLPPAPSTKLSEWYLSNFAIVRNNDEENTNHGTCKTVADIHKPLRVSTNSSKKEGKGGSLFKQVHEFEKSARNFMKDRDWPITKEKIVRSKLPKSHGFWKKVIEKEPQQVTHVQLKCDKLRLGGSTLSQSDDAVHNSSNVIFQTKVADVKTFKPGPLSKKRTLMADNKAGEKWDYKLQQIPSLKIVVKPELGKQLSPFALKYVHLSQMKSSKIDENWARFALSTLTVNRKRLSSATEFAFKIPFKNDQSKVLVKKQKKEVLKFNYGKMSSDNDVEAVLDDLLKFVEKKEFFDTRYQTLSRDPHDLNRNVEDALISNKVDPKKNSDALSVMKRSRTNKQIAELRRLDVQIIEVATMDQIEIKQNYSSDVQNQCSKQICSFGCVCNSLKFGYDYVTNENAHCRNIECMFSCECGYVPIDRLKLKNMMFLPSGTDIMSTETVRRLQIKAQEHLSKEQKKFSQTVIQSQNKTIIVDDLQEKRVRKAAINCKMNFANGWIDDSTKGKDSLADKKKLKINQKSTKEFRSDFQLKLKHPIEFDPNKYMIYCMIHDFYNCPCNNNLTYEFREDFLLNPPKAIRQNSANTNNQAKTKFRSSSGSSSSSTITTTTTTAASNLNATSDSSNTNKKSRNSNKFTSKNTQNINEETVSSKSMDEQFSPRNLRNRKHPSDENSDSESDDCKIVNEEDETNDTNNDANIESAGSEEDNDNIRDNDDDDEDFIDGDSDDFGFKWKKQNSLRNRKRKRKRKRKQQTLNSDVESDDSFEPALPAKAPHLKHVATSNWSHQINPKLPPPLIRLSSPVSARLPPLKTPTEQVTLPFSNSCAETTSVSHKDLRLSRVIQTFFDSCDITKFGLPSTNAQWKSIHLRTKFYCLMFKEFNVAISFEDLQFAALSSVLGKRTILVELKMFNNGNSSPKGIYAVPSFKYRVLLGPFDLNDVIQLQVIGDKNDAPDIIEFVHIDKDQIFSSCNSNIHELEHDSTNNNENLLNKRKSPVENHSLQSKKLKMENKSINDSQDDKNAVHGRKKPIFSVDIDINSNKTPREANSGNEVSIGSNQSAQSSSTNQFPNMVNTNSDPEHLSNISLSMLSKMPVNSSSQPLTAATATAMTAMMGNFLNPLNSAILMKNTNIQTFSTNGLDKSKINGWKWTKKWFVLKCPNIGYFSFYEFKRSNKTEYYFDNPTRKNERIHFKVVENIARYIYEILKKHIFFRPEKLKLNFRIISNPDEIKQIQPFNPSILNFTHILTETCLIKLTTLTADQLEYYNIGNLNGVKVSSNHNNLKETNDTFVTNINKEQITDSNEGLVADGANQICSSVERHSLDTAISNRISSNYSKSTNCSNSQIFEVSSERLENNMNKNVDSNKTGNVCEVGLCYMQP